MGYYTIHEISDMRNLIETQSFPKENSPEFETHFRNF